MKTKKTKIMTHLKNISVMMRAFLKNGPGWFYATFLFLFLYLIIFQSNFVFSGDSWAEAFPEYVNDALTLRWTEIFSSGWAGYLTIIPAAFTNIYIWFGLPLGSIDLFFRAITLLFAIFSISFVAHPLNRGLIKNDYIRVCIAFLLLLSFRHISALAFINIWYVGFFVIILVSLARKNFSKKIYEILYTIFAVLVTLSKTSLVILPFVIYRTIVLKKYVSGIIISIAVLFQTALTVFADTGYGSEDLNLSIIDIVVNGFLSIGILLLKLVQVVPLNIYIVILASLAVISMGLYFIITKQKIVEILLLFFGLALSIYLHVFAPDNSFSSLCTNYLSLYSDQGKFQREFMINFFLLIIIGSFFSHLIYSSTKKVSEVVVISACILGIATIFTINPLREINTNSASVQTGITSFKDSLNIGEPVCVPVPPTPAWDYRARWFFQYEGGCYSTSEALQINENSFTTPITKSGTIITVPSTSKDELKTVIIAVKLSDQFIGDITLTDIDINKQFTEHVVKQDENFQFIYFNTTALGPRDQVYRFKLSSNSELVNIGRFKNSQSYIVYSYFMGYPNIR